MTYEQITLFVLIALVLIGLLWGKWRYDLVAFAALCAAVILGVVDSHHAFDGFGHEATIIVALVLIISAGLSRSGAVDLITRLFVDPNRSMQTHVGLFGALGASLSAFMNNVATLALLMPVDIQAAKKAGRSPAQTLMPLSFATILGGMITLIGTPPNIIIAAYRGQALGESFSMFAFAPVGIAVAIAGLAFVALIGWRLIPVSSSGKGALEELTTLENYVAEMVVPETSKLKGLKVTAVAEQADETDCYIVGLVRNGQRLPGRARREEIKVSDILVVQGSADALNAFAGLTGVRFQGKSGQVAELSADLAVSEVVVMRDSRLVGRTANDVQMLRAHGVSLIGLSRMGKAIKDRIRRTRLQAGDVLLLLGDATAIEDAGSRMGVLRLADRELAVTRHEKAYTAIGLFTGAIVLAAIGLVPLPIALGLVLIAFVLTDILPLRELYDAVEWPVIVLLGSMIPLGTALDQAGGTLLIANSIAGLTADLPAWVALTFILIATMTLSDVLNNTATAVVAAPIAVQLASAVGANPDAFLMAVAIGASCAFLTPIGHKNNMLILGPGGYQFGDYWRMGLPLELLVIAVSVPMIMLVFPL